MALTSIKQEYQKRYVVEGEGMLKAKERRLSLQYTVIRAFL